MKTREWLRLTALAIVTGLSACGVLAEDDMPVGSITSGGHVSQDPFEFFGDVIIPVWGEDGGIVFVNPRASLHDGPEQEINFGVGYRRLLEDPAMIIGGNIFYDSRWTQHGNQFDQVGFGIEALSDWVDFRLNYYIPERLRRTIAERWEQQVTVASERHRGRRYTASDGSILQPIITEITTTTVLSQILTFEEPLEGWDVEVGVALPRLPDWLEARIFGGYYNFSSYYGSDRVTGFRGRAEIRPLPAFSLDVEVYEDPNLKDTSFFAGARMRVPFDLYNLRDGGNPFEGWKEGYQRGKRGLEDRMAELVVRDFRIETQTTTTKKVVSTKVETTQKKEEETIKGPDDDDDKPPRQEEPNGVYDRITEV